LLEGLEISEILKSNLEFSDRIDSEYYRKHFLIFEKKVCKNNFTYLKNVANFLIGPFGSSYNTENYLEDGKYRYVRGQDVKPFILKDEENRFISIEDYQRLKKYALREKDVLVSVVGTLGNACIVQGQDLPAIFSCKSTVIRTSQINPVYVLTFLNCKYGRELLIRKERGVIQKGLNLDDLKTIVIPLFLEIFQTKIESIFYDAQDKLTKSKSQYQQAEALLLDTLGLKDFSPSEEAVNVKSFKESFVATGRLDAEYYQKKYEDYETLLKSYKTGFKPFVEVCKVKDKNYTPKETEEYKYIELANIGKSGEIKDCTVSLGTELPSRARRKVSTNDIIISTIEGSLESCALVAKEYDGALCSTGFLVVKSDLINSETLLVLFKSKPLQNLLKKGCSGTILTAISKTALEQIPIPFIDKSIQEEIKLKITESFRLKKQSEQLLELAKRAVEVAVEDGEERGMEILAK